MDINQWGRAEEYMPTVLPNNNYLVTNISFPITFSNNLTAVASGYRGGDRVIITISSWSTSEYNIVYLNTFTAGNGQLGGYSMLAIGY